METNNLILLSEYGHRHNLEPEDVTRQMRVGVIKIVILDGQRYVKVLNPGVATGGKQTPGVNFAIEPTEQANVQNSSETQEDQAPFSIKTTLKSVSAAAIPLFVIYILTAVYGFFEITNELNRRGSEHASHIDMDRIHRSISEQLAVDFTQVTPQNERERIALATRMFKHAEVEKNLRSLDGLRSIVATGQIDEHFSENGSVSFFTWMRSLRPTGISSYSIVIQNETHSPIIFKVRRSGLTWRLVDVRLR